MWFTCNTKAIKNVIPLSLFNDDTTTKAYLLTRGDKHTTS